MMKQCQKCINFMHPTNKKEKNVPKRNYFSKQTNTISPPKKYISHYLRKVDETQNPRKEERKPTVPHATMTVKSQPMTLKLKGIIKGRNVTILVDSKNTHNYIDIDFAKQLNLFLYPPRTSQIQPLMDRRSRE
jgi:DNA-directed RNA polymerase subunit M/transcription elongation factor TFIIS